MVYNAFRGANVLLLLATLFAYLAPNIHPLKFWPFSFFGLVYPWLLLGNIFFILFWAVLRKWYFLFSLIAILGGWEHFDGLIGLSPRQKAGPEERSIRVMTFNCHTFVDWKKDKRIPDEEVLNFIRTADADLICFQEFPAIDPWRIWTAKSIIQNTSFPYVYQEPQGGLVVLSKYPILKTQTHFFSNRSNGYQYVDFRIDDRRLRLFNVHLQSNSVSSIAEKVAEEGNLQEKETWLRIKGMMGRFRRATRIRAQQAEIIAKNIARSPYPVILCGDFNDVPQSYTYHLLSNGLTDAFKAKGKGLGITYAGNIPALRIDYTLTAPEIRILRHKIGKATFSDHRPLCTEMVLNF